MRSPVSPSNGLHVVCLAERHYDLSWVHYKLRNFVPRGDQKNYTSPWCQTELPLKPVGGFTSPFSLSGPVGREHTTPFRCTLSTTPTIDAILSWYRWCRTNLNIAVSLFDPKASSQRENYIRTFFAADVLCTSARTLKTSARTWQ